MSNILTLSHAATLKGYLLATDAPRAMVLLAEQIVEAASATLSMNAPQRQIPNEEVRLPEPAQLAAAIVKAAKSARSHDEARFAAPEMGLREEEQVAEPVDDGAIEDSPVTTGGGTCKQAPPWTLKAGGIHAPRY